ncbi:MAG TPA: alpha-galactosidase [Candidatus Hydrogenedens sp.]|nr:alpha-galactosidase [Candidatus Hydrogenedens sp.]HPP58868.1 alpha-galactosidase [Candidatus Hydrogenedens sp.]
MFWRYMLLAILVLLGIPLAFGQTSANQDELKMAKDCFERWFGEKLQNKSDLLPGSLIINGESVTSKVDSWQREITPKEKSSVICRTLTLTLPEIGFVVRYEGVYYPDFPVIEWTAYYKNISKEDSPLVQDLKTIDQSFPEFAGQKVILHRNKGDNCTADSYEPIIEEINKESEITLSNTGGRPTQITFPYFNFQRDDGGLIFVISWAGQWSCKFKRDANGVLNIQGGQELTHFILHPGEEVRGPMVVLLYYSGDKRRGQNLWRQWMIAHNLPHPHGSPPKVPLLLACSSHQYGEMVNANTDTQLMFIEKYLKRGFPLDYWWMDAGWYPCDGQWPKTGTWEVDQTRFPGGFKPISEFAHNKGVKILVWFEPERVHAGTWLAENHPEWILGGNNGGLLNLGNPQVREWLTNHIDTLLTNEGIDLYRQDFNIDPLKFWRENDTPDRQGITEIQHVEGYFAYWDELLRRHPNMLIDSCASGGRRNDLETLRRAVPLLRSDYIMEPIGNQCHTWALSEWFPFYGTGTSKTSDYEVISVLCPSFTACFDQRDDNINWERLQELMQQRNVYGENYFGDYYPLTPYSLSKNVWIAWQFNMSKKGTGFIQAFRREGCDNSEISLPLYGLNSNKKYKITPLTNNAKSLEINGDELMKKGIPLQIPEKPGALIVIYQTTD